MKKTMMIFSALMLVSSIALANASDKAESVKMVDSQIAKWQDGFLKYCQNQTERATENKRSKEFCLCAIKKHRDFLVKKIDDGEDVDVAQHLKDLSDMYKNASGSDTDSDEPTIADLDMDLTRSCLKSKPAQPAKKK